ncbi:MAG: two-component regulator propeller domain-containing protein [Paludibacter sp.]|nr:two-component regulator propeller domain-containing protein [Paludibacter sp.]
MFLFGISKNNIREDFYTNFRNLTIRDGLSDNYILDIRQGTDGYIWIATRDGLNRFDGYTIKIFTHVENDSTSLPDNYVTSICFDKKGRLWVGTQRGLAVYNASNESFDLYCVHSGSKIGISNAYVRRIMCDNKFHALWVETIDGMLNLIDLENNRIRHFSHSRTLAPQYDYHEIFQDKKGLIWLGGRDFGPLLFDESMSSFKQLPVDPDNADMKRDNDIASIYQDVNNYYWMSATDGFYQYLPGKNIFKKFLPTSTYDIIQKDSVNLWLATASGLAQFNTQNKDVVWFKYNQNKANSLINNHVNVLLNDANGNLWIGTSAGISILYKKSSFFTHYKHIPDLNFSLPYNKIKTFFEFDKNKVWIGTDGAGVIEWNKKENSFHVITGTEDQRISTIYRDKLNNIWIGMWSGKGFLKYSPDGKIKHYAYDHNTLKKDWYNDFYEDNSGMLWTGIWGASGVQFFNPKTETFEDYNLQLPESPVRSELRKLAVQDNYVWVFSRGIPLYRYDIKNRVYQGWGSWDSAKYVLPQWRSENNYHYDADVQFKLVFQVAANPARDVSYWVTNDGLYAFYNNSFNKISGQLKNIYSICQTTVDTIYLSCEKGICLFDTRTGKYKFIDENKKSEPYKLFAVNAKLLLVVSDTNVAFFDLNKNSWINNTLCEKIKDRLISTNKVLFPDSVWIATDKGLIRTDAEFKKYRVYDLSNSFANGLISETINDICKCGEGLLCLATEKGLLLYNTNDKAFKLVESTSGLSVKAIGLADNCLWMATLNGLMYYDLRNKNVVAVSNLTRHKLSSHLISFIQKDSLGNIWIGTTNNGVNKLTPDFNIWQYLPDKRKSGALWGENATDFAINQKQQIFISTNTGINQYNGSKEGFSHMTTKDGLKNNHVLGIEFDANGNLWMITQDALQVYNPDKKCMKTFDEEWGLLPVEFSGDITKIGDQMLISSDGGFYTFQPDDLINQNFKNNLGFTGLKVYANDKPVDFSCNRSIELNYDENFFTIYFSDFEFKESPTTYRYKLEKIDQQWIKTEHNFAAYTNINPGRYKLLVNTELNYIAGLSPIELMIVVNPPFWEKGWFIAMEILIVAFVLYFIYLQQINRYKLRERNLMIEQKLLLSQMNPHFVFNALNAIQSFIFKSETKDAVKYLSKFAKLMRLNLQNTRHEFVLLSQEIEVLEYYMELQRLRFDNKFIYKIVLDDAVDDDNIMIPPMLTQPFIENVIEHGFKNIDYEGKIQLSYNIKLDGLEIVIQDNGVGINNSVKNENHKSLATIIIKERLAFLSKKYKSKYELSMTDLSELDSHQTGTIVQFKVPCVCPKVK